VTDQHIRAQLRRGVPADMVYYGSRDGLAELWPKTIAIRVRLDLGRVPLGGGVRAGTSRPNIGLWTPSNRHCFALKSIGIHRTSAIYLRTKVFPQLGIAIALEAKLSNAGAGQCSRRRKRR